VEGGYSIGVGTVDDFCRVLPRRRLGFSSLLQHHLGLVGVGAGAGGQELCGPVEPHALPETQEDAVSEVNLCLVAH